MSNQTNAQPLIRTIHLQKMIDQETSAKFIEDILKINDEDDEKEKAVVGYERKPIKVILNSPGGAVYAGLGMCGVIESSKTPVHGYIYGYAMSMALLLTRFFHKSYASRLATFMFHESSGGIKYWEPLEGVQDSLDEGKRTMEIYIKELLSRTSIPKHKIQESIDFKKDWFFSAEEALEYGLIDEFIK